MCNSPFIFCSSPAAWAAPSEKGVYFQSVQISHKKMPRLSGIIRVHSGRTERTSPHNLRKALPAMPMQAYFPAGAAAAAAHSRPIKKLSPVAMRGNSQNGGQTTKSLLITPQCSGVPIQQAVSLSSSFPRHCLLFVAFFAGRLHLPLQKSCRTAFVQQLFVIRSVFSHGDLPDGSRFRTLPHRAQAPARCRPGYRWGSAHRGTAG